MDLLKKLHLSDRQSGASTGSDWWSTHTESGEISSLNPTTGDNIARIFRSSNEDYDHVIQTASQAFTRFRHVPAPKRGEMVRAIGDELRQYKDALGSLVSLEMGKSKQEGDGEVQEMIDMADLAVGQSRMLYGLSMHSERPQHRMYEEWHPLGVVGIVSAFNFPVAVWAWNAFIAAICGNTVIWKPSPKTSLCALAVQHICNRVTERFGYQGIFSLLTSDDNAMVHKMAKDKPIALLSFTGSTTVGRELNALVAERLGRSLLELSGNNAVIVDKEINLKLAVPAIVFSAIGTAGQRCTTTRRLIIHETIYEEARAALEKAYAKIIVGDPLNARNHMGPLIDQDAVTRFLAAVSDAQKQGGRLLYGGKAVLGPGYFVEPTLIEADNQLAMVRRETFAPILYLMKYRTLDEAIAMQNDSAFGLSSSLFTDRLQHAEQFLSVAGSDCGIANINLGTSGAEIGGAFGGEKDTGGGREAGSDIWKAYMRRQTCTINWGSTLTLAQGIQFGI